MKTPGAVCAATLLATTALAGTPEDRASQPRLELRIAVVDVCGVGADSARAAVAQAAWLLQRSGVQLTARHVSPGEDFAADDVHVVAILNARPLRDSRRARVGGEVDRRVARAIWIHPPEIESLPPSVLPLGRDLRFRRLLGLAIAHELLHLVADAPHAGHGVMAPSLHGRTSLLDTWIDTRLFPRLRAGVARLESDLPPTPASPAALAARLDPPEDAVAAPR